MSKPKLKPGTIVELTDSATKWKADHADEVHDYPYCFINKTAEYKLDNLNSYLIDKLSYPAELKLHGVIVGDNGYNDEDFAYLVWSANQIGEDIEWISPKDFEVIR